MLLYSPAGSEGVDSCVANCNYGSYWDGEECSPCPEDTYLGFDTYFSSATGTVMASYNENKASPKYGDGTGNSDLCIPCGTLNLGVFSDGAYTMVSVAGDTDGDEGLAMCQFIISD